MKNILLFTLFFSFLISHDGDHSDDHSHDRGNGGPPKIGAVYGEVINANTSEPIEYVSISIYNSNTKKIESGGITDSYGFFSVDEITPGSYFIMVEFIGYEIIVIEDIKLNRNEGIKRNLGTISLTPKAIESSEIDVEGEISKVEFETDKIVYTPSNDILATSGSAEDVLNKVPMVIVDQDGIVTLKGSSNVKVLVNGRENRIGDGGNDVDNIPGSMIEKVEVITSPSAKYDPEGMAGIINIVLKKDKDRGFNGEIKFYTKQNKNHDFMDMGGFSLNANYKINKFNIYTSYSNNLRYNNRNGYRKAFTTYTHPDSLESLADSIYFKVGDEKKKEGQVLRLGTDYYLDNDLTLNFESRYNAYTSKTDDVETTILPSPSIRNSSDKESNGNYEVGISFSADKTYDNPDKNLSLFYSFDTHPVDKGTTTSTLFEGDIDEGYESTSSHTSSLQSQELDFSYITPVNDKSKFELGYNFDQTDNDESMDYNLFVNTENNDNSLYITGENTYKYKRNIHAIFFEYSTELNDRWSIKPGIRFEQVSKNIQFKGMPDTWFLDNIEYDTFDECQEATLTLEGCWSDEDPEDGTPQCSECQLTSNPTDQIGAYAQMLKENNNTNYKNSYTSLYPSFHVTYKIDKERSLQFAISSRVERPGGGHHGGSRQIRPFPRDMHSNNFIFLGNTKLKPQYSTNYELSYQSPIPMGFFYTNIYFNDVRDMIEWYSDNSYKNFDVVTFENADKAKSYGLEYYFMVMGQTISGAFWYNNLQDGSDDSELNGINSGMRMYGNMSLPEKDIKYFGLELGFYYMKMNTDYGTMLGNKGTIWANMGLTKSIFNNQARISFNIDNIFDSGGFSMEVTRPLVLGIDYIEPGYLGGTEYTDYSSSRNGRTYSITLKYNFGELQKDKRKYRGGDSGRGSGIDMGF